jgi:hypothetical protein
VPSFIEKIDNKMAVLCFYRSNMNNKMARLLFGRSRSNAPGQEWSTAMCIEELKQANVDETTTGLHFVNYRFDEDTIVHAVIDLIHRTFQKGCLLEYLAIEKCTGRIDEILQAASSLDMFDKIMVFGHSDDHLSLHGFLSISAAMKCNKRLAYLHLSNMEMPRQQADALGAGLVTSNHFKDLRMTDMRFTDGAVKKLASRLKQNSSLCILQAKNCNLGDAEVAELMEAVESNPSLKQLSLTGNEGQELALVALGKVLASKSCQLEELYFDYQATDHGGLTGHLGMLVHGFLQGSKSLTLLELSSNGLLDSDIDQLGQILTTCKLERLNLTRNNITHSGFVSLTQNTPNSLNFFDFSTNNFDKEEAACHTLTLFQEHSQLWEDGFNWKESMSPKHQEIQHFKDLNRCGRILLASEGAIALSVWPVVLARANTLLSDSKERATNAIFHLLQGPALMQRRFDRD